MNVTTDDRPFHFDVDPHRPEIKQAYQRILLLTLFLLPFFTPLITRHRKRLGHCLSFVFIVGITGLAYLMIEVVLIQRFQLFLGYPVVAFVTVLGTLLIFSGLGSLGSGRISRNKIYVFAGFLVLMLLIHLWLVPLFLQAKAAYPLPLKIVISVAVLAPLAFFMGIPFPYVMRMCKSHFTQSSVAVLFSINAATSALAVPLTLSISTVWGMKATFLVSVFLYLCVCLSLVALHKPTLLKPVNWVVALFLLVVLLSPWLSSSTAPVQAFEGQRYRVYGISYGQSNYQVRKVFADRSGSGRIPFEWLFWVIQGNGKTILVDTGCDNSELVNRWKIKGYVKPVERLRHLGISASDVTDVIITHAHWDHMGGLAAYPNAKIWMQKQEFEHAKTCTNRRKPIVKGIHQKDLELLLKAKRDGRLCLVQDTQTLVPGIDMIPGGSHTPGFQYVSVETLDGKVIIAGDTSYLYKNNHWHKAIGSCLDPAANLATIQKMQRMAASPFYILPGHDPRVMKWFPKVADGIVQITAIPR